VNSHGLRPWPAAVASFASWHSLKEALPAPAFKLALSLVPTERSTIGLQKGVLVEEYDRIFDKIIVVKRLWRFRLSRPSYPFPRMFRHGSRTLSIVCVMMCVLMCVLLLKEFVVGG
jgi:hypothetical protein